ncbi:hypothetical protein HBI56_106170 [Parastagonospora nodorum]|nr:hypothetical protein HBH53_087680 [Parastagonospora nodorum]KAH3995950.1 hypothetical protein HBI10_165010 [Parastagonospora nodorum]KAH4021689.1 hypothetical protein HBI13_106260 [Parastagonospora nodorum]KAH4030437.1 hypothetical protein HBI09_129730 [Parastagonospora nodorum]KAH4048318.1 hypothetical protein HBH49_156630 [Parastagonospora nodorum]
MAELNVAVHYKLRIRIRAANFSADSISTSQYRTHKTYYTTTDSRHITAHQETHQIVKTIHSVGKVYCKTLNIEQRGGYQYVHLKLPLNLHRGNKRQSCITCIS